MKMTKKLLLSSIGATVLLSAPASAVEVINLMTEEAGMHRIDYNALVNRGVNLAGQRHRQFAITYRGNKIPTRTKGQDQGRPAFFGPGGFIEFYAQANDSQYSNQVAYTLHVGEPNQRNNIDTTDLSYNPNVESSDEYQVTVEVEENRRYDYLAPSKNDPWHYGQIFGAGFTQGPSYTFDLDGADGATATISAEVYGIVDLEGDGNDHHPELVVNGEAIANLQFDGNQAVSLTGEASVNSGENTLRIDLKGIEGQPFDAVALNQFSVSYTRAAVVTQEDAYLEGAFDSAQVKVSGVTDAQVYRRAGNRVTRIIGGSPIDGNAFGFSTGGVAADYIVVGSNDSYKKPQVAMIQDDADITSGEAEYLIISHALFMGEDLDALVEMREVDYSVKVVDVAQVYAQFGNHVPSADAIRDYVKHAVANMGTRFVTLVGSDTYDYRNFSGSGSVSYIPTNYATTPGGGILTINQTPSDAKYGDVDDDNVPDVAVGRLSVRSPQELANVIEKIRDYQAREGYAGRILLAADKEDVATGVNFTDDAMDMMNAIPQADWRNAVMGSNRAGWRALPDVDGDQAAHDKLMVAMNAGVSVVAYVGHSSQQSWAFTTPSMLKSTEISSLNNTNKPAVVTQWGCWNTYFVHPDGNSMGDQFLVNNDRGAVAVLGASTLTSSSGERALGLELSKHMYQEGMTIGEAIILAKQSLAQINPEAIDIQLGWQVLGDPALVINP